jgi:uncharacterized membrane protein (UPF0182 family)
MTLKLPGQEKAAFSLTSSFVPRGNRQNLTAFAAVNSDNGPDYGKISVLQLPRSTNISGPSQVASNFEAKPEVAQALSLLRQGGSDVVLGNLLTLPVGGGLLYVQPVYVRATANNSAYPLLQKVLVSFGDVIEGPAVINEHTATTIMHQGDRAEVGQFGEIVIQVGKVK